jgi:hypothetical protein
LRILDPTNTFAWSVPVETPDPREFPTEFSLTLIDHSGQAGFGAGTIRSNQLAVPEPARTSLVGCGLVFALIFRAASQLRPVR